MNIFPILSDPRTWNFLCAARGSHGAALLGKHTQLSIKSDEYNYINFFFIYFFIYNIYFLWEKTLAWGHSNPATYVLKTEGDYQYGFGCNATHIVADWLHPNTVLQHTRHSDSCSKLANIKSMFSS